MSFYHILPSNTSPQYFPNNNASQFSTPIESSYHFMGKWEVAITDMTYSSCIKSFNDDIIIVKEKRSNEKERSSKYLFEKSAEPVKCWISTPTKHGLDGIFEIEDEIQKKLTKKLIDLSHTKDKKFITWRLSKPNFVILVSETIRKIFGLTTDVLTPWDYEGSNTFLLNKEFRSPPTNDDLYFIYIPVNYNVKQFELKKEKENITAETLVSRFNDLIPKELAQLAMDKKKYLTIEKKDGDNCIIIISSGLSKMMNVYQAGAFRHNIKSYTAYSSKYDVKPSWIVTVLSIDFSEIHRNDIRETTRTIKLRPCSFREPKDAISFLTNEIGDKRITFSYNKRMQLKIADPHLTVWFDDTLRDILAFDKNTYQGKGDFYASDVISLTRRIHYLYVYSNISDFIHIGDTKAPLLAVIPFHSSDSCEFIHEKNFKHPMYVPVITDRISQINIGIYDGAGQLIPFIQDAVTTLRLHFRQV